MTRDKRKNASQWQPSGVKTPPPWTRAVGCGCGIIALLLGLAVIGFTIWQIRVSDEFADRAISVPGKVVWTDERTERGGAGRYGRHNRTTKISTISYTDKTGARHELQERKSESGDTRRRGDVVTVLYDPESPEDAVVDDYLGRRADIIEAKLAGLFFAGLGVMLLYLLFRDYRARRQAAENVEAELHQSRGDGGIFS